LKTLKYKTISANKSTINKDWLLVDVSGINLGRASSEISKLLRGKHKPNFTPHVDCGDYVIVINASKINLTGNKWKHKKYISHSGYPGGQKIISVENQFQKNPNKIIEKAVKGMLPKNKLGNLIFKNLKVFSGNNHNHEGQKPVLINITR
tara:strand:+ start:68 stop:517 length:450 start_codon:yes stop_codon:yes gene_type:complete